jgi:hypothetical protein
MKFAFVCAYGKIEERKKYMLRLSAKLLKVGRLCFNHLCTRPSEQTPFFLVAFSRHRLSLTCLM